VAAFPISVEADVAAFPISAEADVAAFPISAEVGLTAVSIVEASSSTANNAATSSSSVAGITTNIDSESDPYDEIPTINSVIRTDEVGSNHRRRTTSLA